MQTPLRIYLVGAHATGKTTLARWIRDHYGLPMISEVARGVLAEMEAQLDAERDQLGSFVSDRAFCNLAYAAQHATILSQLATDVRLLEYMRSVKEGLVFFLRPHRELLSEDGVRAGVQWEEVLRIDGMVKFMLELFGIPYIPVDCLAMQERVRLLERVLSLAGVAPVDPDAVAGSNGFGKLRENPRETNGKRDGNGAGSHAAEVLAR